MDSCDLIRQVGGFIKDVGFPVAVAVYFLVEGRKLLRQNLEAVHGLRRALTEYGIGARGGPAGLPPTHGGSG